jgi:hypothetical protein
VSGREGHSGTASLTNSRAVARSARSRVLQVRREGNDGAQPPGAVNEIGGTITPAPWLDSIVLERSGGWIWAKECEGPPELVCFGSCC